MNAFLEKISGYKTLCGFVMLIFTAVHRWLLPDQTDISLALFGAAMAVLGAGSFDRLRKKAEGDKVD